MATRIGLVCLLWVVGAVAQCVEDGGWYGGARMAPADQELSASVEERLPSFEDASDEYYPVKRERYHRSSHRYSPHAYGYGNEVQLQDSGDWERHTGGPAPARKPARYDTQKARRKYGTYGKSSRTSYGYKGAVDGANGERYERRKTSRAAQYSGGGGGGGEGGGYGKTTSLTFKAVAPKPNCAQNLLIGCTPTVTRLPCSASAPYEPYGGAHPEAAPYYPAPPMYHHAPPPPPPAAHYGPPHPVYPGYPPHPAGYYYPPPPPAAPAPPTHYPKPAPSDAQPKPAHEGGAPSYKAATADAEIPGFAAPVREQLSESTKVPIISAFHQPSAPANGTANQAERKEAPGGGTGSTANPMPVLTTTTEANEDNDEFWAVESNTESSTDAAAVEASTAR